MKKLSEWAKENNVSYHTAYHWYREGKLPVSAHKNAGGSIFVAETSNPPSDPIPAPVEENSKSLKNVLTEPRMVSFASDVSTRRNAASTIVRTDRFTNIDNAVVPFNAKSYGNGRSVLSVQEAIVLCQKAYYNFAAFRTVIDLMTEFAIGEIYFRGGNDKSRAFFKAFWEKVDLWSLQDRFFREYFRSGNVFLHRMDAFLTKSDALKLTQVYGGELFAEELSLPFQYVIINPADIELAGSVSYLNTEYAKTLNSFELERLRNPKTQEDLEFLESLPNNVKEQIKKKHIEVSIPLDPSKLFAVFYKKQDYEPLAIPLGFPVLEDINWKQELKKMDMAIARTMQQAILLITVGQEMKDGSLYINQKLVDAIQEMFTNQSVGRVLVSDFTTKAEFVIPQIADILDPKKYEVVNEDIRTGLNNILIGEDKFANQQIKVQVFVERLKHARMAFKRSVLIPEIKRISQLLGFKVYPMPYYPSISLENKVEWARIYSRLGEIGALTNEEIMQAINDGRLPTPDESVDSQKSYKKFRDDGLYTPLIGGAKDMTGRPKGTTGIPQSTKNVGPIGASEKYSLAKMREVMGEASNLTKEVQSALMKKHKLKKLNIDQANIADEIAELIMVNEKPSNWKEAVKAYVNDPQDHNKTQVKEVESIAQKHQVKMYLASLLYHSQNE